MSPRWWSWTMNRRSTLRRTTRRILTSTSTQSRGSDPMGIAYEFVLEASGDSRLMLNLAGVGHDDTVGADQLVLNVFAYSRSTNRLVFSARLDIAGSRRLYDYLNGVSLIRDASAQRSQ